MPSTVRLALVLIAGLAPALPLSGAPTGHLESAAPARAQTPAQTPPSTPAPDATPAAKVPPKKLVAPPTWRVRSDATGGADTGIYFVSMPPGWHITTGPGVTLHDPDTRAAGRFRVESTIFLFPAAAANTSKDTTAGAGAGAASARASANTSATSASDGGYGLLVGGRDLDSATRRYTAFLLRRDGQFAIVTQRGDTRTITLPWTAHFAIVPHTDPKASGEPVKNILSLDVDAQTIIVSVNGQELARGARGDLDLDGIVGLRVDRDLNLHVATLQVTTP